MKRLTKLGIILSLALLGAGCSQSLQTVVDAGSLCKDWQVYRPQADDKLTEKSAAQLLANNESRVVWGCARMANEAA